MNLNKQMQSYVFRCLEKQVDPTEIIPLGRIPGLSKQVNVSYEETFIVMEIMDAWVCIFTYPRNSGN